MDAAYGVHPSHCSPCAQARLREAMQQVEEEEQQRQRDLEKALKDPKKAELYRKLKETMPDIPISMR